MKILSKITSHYELGMISLNAVLEFTSIVYAFCFFAIILDLTWVLHESPSMIDILKFKIYCLVRAFFAEHAVTRCEKIYPILKINFQMTF